MRRPGPVVSLSFLGALVCAGVWAVSAASYSSPAPVLTGLSHPGASAIGPDGSRYFTQHPDALDSSLWVLPPGASSATELYAVTGDPSCTGPNCGPPAIFSVDFDKHGDVYFGVQVYHSTTVDSSLIRIDRQGRLNAIWSASAGSPDQGSTITSGELLEAIAVSGSDVYLGTSAFDATLQTQVARIVVLHAKKPPGLLAQLNGPGPRDSVNQLAVTAAGTVYAVDFDGNSSRGLYEITGSSVRLVTSLPGIGPYLGVDGQGNVLVFQRTFNNRTSPVCADSTTVDILRFAAGANGISGTPTVYSEATYPGVQFVWIPGSSLYRVTPAGDVYFALTHAHCPPGPGSPFIDHAALIGINAARGRQEVLDSWDTSDPSFQVYEAGFSAAIDGSTGQLWVTNEETGALETVAYG